MGPTANTKVIRTRYKKEKIIINERDEYFEISSIRVDCNTRLYSYLYCWLEMYKYTDNLSAKSTTMLACEYFANIFTKSIFFEKSLHLDQIRRT